MHACSLGITGADYNYMLSYTCKQPYTLIILTLNNCRLIKNKCNCETVTKPTIKTYTKLIVVYFCVRMHGQEMGIRNNKIISNGL